MHYASYYEFMIFFLLESMLATLGYLFFTLKKNIRPLEQYGPMI
jgi:hypothetical protein